MPPGPFFQKLNAKLHQEPWSSLTYGLFWIFTLTSSWVLVVSALLGRTVSQLLIHLLFPGASKAYDPSNSEMNASFDMAVVITGCDSGFGRDLALRAADLGFTVFAGCLDPNANGNSAADMAKLTKGTIYPLPMNVTSDEQVAAAASAVSTWLKGSDGSDDSNKDAPAKRRILHALVNNAGIGVGGLVDWTDVTFFQQSIDVNYIGMVRVCKAFLPIFKQQAIQEPRVHVGAMRICNMTSMAGLVASGLTGFSAYVASKHAANAFSSVLRAELKGFGIQVTTINPSFHGTALVNTMGDKLRQVWDGLDATTKDEYGEAYFERLKFISVDIPHMVTWNADVVVDEVLKCLVAKRTPPDLLIGTDARYSLPILRMLPAWCLDAVLLALNGPATPAAMKKAANV